MIDGSASHCSDCCLPAHENFLCRTGLPSLVFKEKGKRVEWTAVLAEILTDLLYPTIEGEMVKKVEKALLCASKISQLSPEHLKLQMNSTNLDM